MLFISIHVVMMERKTFFLLLFVFRQKLVSSFSSKIIFDKNRHDQLFTKNRATYLKFSNKRIKKSSFMSFDLCTLFFLNASHVCFQQKLESTLS